jgi:hypothetical protein
MRQPYKITVKAITNKYNKRIYDRQGQELLCIYLLITYKRLSTKIPTGYYISQLDFDADRMPKAVLSQIDLVKTSMKFERDRTSLDTLRGFGKRFKIYKENAVVGLMLFNHRKIDEIFQRLIVATKYYSWKRLSLKDGIKEGIKILQEEGKLTKLKAIDPVAKLTEQDRELTLIEVIQKYTPWARKIGLVDSILTSRKQYE